MSQHIHTTCDGCGEEMELQKLGQMGGTISFYGQDDEQKHFHSPRCLARFAEKVNNGLFAMGLPRIRVTVEEVEED